MKILLVEDDDLWIKVLTRSLAPHHFVVDVVKDGEMGWTYSSTFEYDLIVMDIVLPKLDGISLCRRLRSEGYATPILLLSAQDAIAVKVQGLDAGADDYLVKPCDLSELVARVRALLRRGSPNPFPLLAWGDLLLNPSTCEVSYNGQPLILTTKEYEFLELLLRDSQHVFSTDELLDRLWSSEEFPSDATVRSHLRRVRNKLVAAGAPADFIATLHGRGYYLKPPESPGENVPVAMDLPSAIAPWEMVGSNVQLESQQEYFALLRETWTTAQPKSLEQVMLLEQAIRDLPNQGFAGSRQQQVLQIAHQLAGTLSVFGLTQAMELARQLAHHLGHWLGSPNQSQSHLPSMQALVTALQQAIQNATLRSILPPSADCTHADRTPLLLLASADGRFNRELVTAAAGRGIRVAIATNRAAFDAPGNSLKQHPDALLLRLPYEATAARDWLETMQIWARSYPAMPILVMSDRRDMRDRLEVMRHGGNLFLEISTSPEQVLDVLLQILFQERSDILSPLKVMIVDDDRDWLHLLLTLLKPWEFKVTTLDDPQQFWVVLQSVVPDVLVLDVNMPRIDGFEICQILRSDPHWQRLPVLFLSVLADTASRDRAFAVGADDYLCKPVTGGELANRILNRMRRIRAWAGS